MNYENIYKPVLHRRRPPVHTGGLCWLVFAKWEDVLLWPQVNPETGLCSTPIKLKEGCTWYECKLVDKGRLFTETMKVSPAGPYWDFSITGYFGGNNTAHVLASGTMQYHKYVVMFKDRDGQIRFFGNEDAGADIEEGYTSGEKDSSRKRTVTFSSEHPQPAPIYVGSLEDITDDIIVPPFDGCGAFGNDFGDDFDIGHCDNGSGEFNDDYNNDFNG